MMMHSICQQIWKTQQWPQDWERSVFIPISKKVSAKVWQKITLNIFQSILGCVSETFKLHILITNQVFMYPCLDYFHEMIKVMRWEINSRMIFFVSFTALTWDARIRIIESIYTENYHCSQLVFFFFFILSLNLIFFEEYMCFFG